MTGPWVKGLHLDTVEIHEEALRFQTEEIQIDGDLVTFHTSAGVIRYYLVAFDHVSRYFRGLMVRPTVFAEELAS